MMARIPAKSALVLFLQVTVSVLVLSPMTANCLSLDDRAQLKQLTEEFVRKTNSIICFLIIHSNFNEVQHIYTLITVRVIFIFQGQNKGPFGSQRRVFRCRTCSIGGKGSATWIADQGIAEGKRSRVCHWIKFGRKERLIPQDVSRTSRIGSESDIRNALDWSRRPGRRRRSHLRLLQHGDR